MSTHVLVINNNSISNK